MRQRTYRWLAALLLLGNALVASEITNIQRVGSNLNFNLSCDRYAEYLIQRSTNLTDWETLRRSFGPSTNRAFQFFGPNDPAQSKAFFRAMQTNEPIAAGALIAKQTIAFSGSGADWPWVDSYDSSDPNYSTTTNYVLYPGDYDWSKRKDTAFVASLSSATNAIDTSGGEILGSAATASGGIVLGHVGDGAWLLTQSGIQPGHVRDDFDQSIPDATLPANFSSTPAPIPVTGLLVTQDYKNTGDLSAGFVVVANQRARLWVTGNVDFQGSDSIVINFGGSLEIYVGGSSVNFGGYTSLNRSGNASHCTIWGLPTCTSMRFSAGAEIVTRLYAPQADVRFLGTAQGFGAFTAKSFSLAGPVGIHLDEALAR